MKKQLENGNQYTLQDLFSGERKIIIPDLQRDYCWGDKKHGKEKIELVTGFVSDIIDLFNESKDKEQQLGMIYAYDNPLNFIQLIDGQQRITTLYLLLGMLYKYSKSENEDLRRILISDFELEEDDKEPHLQYAIRESTLYFLSDLVCKFFLKNDSENFSIDKIIKEKWYFSEYDLDPTIQSMLSALSIIDKLIKKNIKIDEFAEFIMQKIKFFYFDMQNREHGEDMFVVINTTGEPLTATENLKPILLGNLDDNEKKFPNIEGGDNKSTALEYFSNQWEEREQWFWKNRSGSGEKGNNIADHGVNEFFRWVTTLMFDFNDKKETNKNIDLVRSSVTDFIKPKSKETNKLVAYLKELHKYFEIVKFIFGDNNIFSEHKDLLAPNKKDKYANTQITWFKLLPVIAYLKRFGLDVEERKIIRVKIFFENLSRIDNVSKNVGGLIFDAINLILKMPNDDIALSKNLDNISTQILSNEEKMKFDIYLNSENRDCVEDLFWESERHLVWNGEILPLLEWAKNGDDIFDKDSFEKYNDVFNKLFYDELDYEELDLTRRALLTRNLKDYPRIFSGWTNYSFCWEYSDWQTLINDNKEKFGKFISELNRDNIETQLEEMVKNNSPEKDYDEFVKIPELLKFCEKKNMQWKEEKGWILIRKKMRSGEHANLKAYRLYLDLNKEIDSWNQKQWKLEFYKYEGSCVVFDYESKNIAIDIKYIGSDKFQIQMFCRNTKPEDYKKQLSTVAERLELEWDNNCERYVTLEKEENNIKEILKSILKYNYSNL